MSAARQALGALRPPRPLALLLPVVLLCTTIWSVWSPMWQAPDEPQHFGYAESLVELGHKPDRGTSVDARDRIKGEPAAEDANDISSVSQRTLAATNAYPVAFDLYAKPPWGETAETRYEREAEKGPRDNGGRETGATSYPPLYYALETIPYRAASSGNAVDRVYLMRWFSGLWALVAAVGGWLLAGEVFGRRRLVQLVAAATLGLWPMIDFLAAAVNPDGMLTALSALALWLTVRVARRGAALWPCVALIVVVGLATYTKVSGAALAPAALFAVIAGLPQVRARTGDRVRPLLGLAAALFVLPLLLLLLAESAGVLPAQLAQIVAYRPDPNGFASYLWQFYLPRLDSMTPQLFQYRVISALPVYNLWLGTSWATFGWVDIWFPAWVYRIFLGLTLAVLAGAAVTAVRSLRRRRGTVATRGSATVTIALAIAAVGVLAGVHLQDYYNGTHKLLPFAQGRYLFPVAGIGALVVGGALLALPARLRTPAAAAWVGFLLVFQVAAFGLIATRFYA